MSQETYNPYNNLSENCQSVAKEIENKLIGLSIQEAIEVIGSVFRAIKANNKVTHEN